MLITVVPDTFRVLFITVVPEILKNPLSIILAKYEFPETLNILKVGV